MELGAVMAMSSPVRPDQRYARLFAALSGSNVPGLHNSPEPHDLPDQTGWVRIACNSTMFGAVDPLTHLYDGARMDCWTLSR